MRNVRGIKTISTVLVTNRMDHCTVTQEVGIISFRVRGGGGGETLRFLCPPDKYIGSRKGNGVLLHCFRAGILPTGTANMSTRPPSFPRISSKGQ